MNNILATTAITIAVISPPAMAQTCKNIILNIANDAGELMKVVQIKAYNRNDDRWRIVTKRNYNLRPTNPPELGYRLDNLDIRRSKGESVAIRVKYKFVYGSDNRRYYTDTRFRTCESNRSVWSATIPSANHTLVR